MIRLCLCTSLCNDLCMTTTTKTPNGIHLGQQVTFVEFSEPITCTVVGIKDAGLRVLLDDGNGYIGYPVACQRVTPVKVETPEVATTTPAIKAGDTVTYSGDYRTPITHTVLAVTPTGLRLDEGFGDLGYAVDPSQVTLVTAAPTAVEPTPAPVAVEPATEAPTPAAAPTTRRPPLLTKRPLPARTSTRMSKTAANTIADLGCSAEISRGRGHGRLDVTQIKCLHDRGYLIALTDPANPNRITGAVITGKGVHRALEILNQQPARPALTLITTPKPEVEENMAKKLTNPQIEVLCAANSEDLLRAPWGAYFTSRKAVTPTAQKLYDCGLLEHTGIRVTWFGDRSRQTSGELIRPSQAGYEVLKSIGIRVDAPTSNAA